MRQHPLAAIREAVALGVRGIIVGVSCGKDSLATLDLCCQHFERVEAYYQYITPGLSFHECTLRYLERRYRIQIHRRPHWQLAAILRGGTFRQSSLRMVGLPRWTIATVEADERVRTGLDWHATGQKQCDSLQRRGMLSRWGAVDQDRRRLYPLAAWSHRAVFAYLKRRRVPLPADYRMLGHSYGGELTAESLIPIKRAFPDDYRRIQERFPWVEAEILRHRLAGDRASAAQHGEAIATQERPVQPAGD